MSDTCVDPVGCQMTPPNLILLCDFGRRSTDEYMLAAASAMQEMGSIQLVAVIVMGTPQEKCASLVRTTLDSLGMYNVPVGYTETETGQSATFFTDEYADTLSGVSLDSDLATRKIGEC